MKKVLLFALLCFSLHGLAQEQAAPIYVGATPASGSEITTDDNGNLTIVLQFDFSDLIAQYGASDLYGVGYQGNANPWGDPNQMGAVLLEGSYEEGTFMQKVNTTMFRGKSEGFKAGNTLDISFPSVILTPGQTYTVVINHNIHIFEVGSTTRVGIPLMIKTDPIILSYTAKKTDTGVVLESCSMNNNAVVETVGLVTYQFNNEIEIVPGANALIMEGETVVMQSPLSVSETDSKTAVADFGGKTVYRNRKYVLVLPENSVCLKGDNSWFNLESRVPFAGSGKGYATFNSSTPESGTVAFPDPITINFDIAEDDIKIDSDNWYNYMDVYDGVVSEATYVTKLDGVPSADGKSITFGFNKPVVPEKKYVFDIPADRLVMVRNGLPTSSWSNDSVRLELTAPSIEAMDLPAIEFGVPIAGKHGVSTDTINFDEPVENILTMEIPLKDLHYSYKGMKGGLFRIINEGYDPTSEKGYLYDITNGTETLVKEFTISLSTRENPFTYYKVIEARVYCTFFEGHKYRLVIPEDTYCIGWTPYWNYLGMPELAYEFYGAAPSEVKLIRCSLEDNTERSTLCNVIYEFDGEFEFNPAMTAKLNSLYTYNQMLTSTVELGTTTVVAHIYDEKTGGPWKLIEGRTYTLTLPAGTLFYSGDSTIQNEDIVRTITAVAPTPAVDFIDLTVTVNGSHATTNKAAKGETTQVTFTPDEYWQVESVSQDGNNVTNLVRNGVYTTPVLDQNTAIEATIAYAGQLMVEQVSGIFSIPESSIKVRTEAGRILVEGVSPDDTITVYNLAGMTVCTVTPEHDIVKISVEPGRAYIVRVNQHAAKVMP